MNVTQSKAKWWLMAISIVLGCISAWAIDQHLSEKTEEIESHSRLDQVSLLVATRDLSRDAVIEDTDFLAEDFPLKWAPDESISYDQSDFVIGKRLLNDVRAGQPLLFIHLKDPEAPGISTQLPPEHKAVSITIDPSSAASGLIKTGDQVDLFVSLDHQGKRVTMALLQGVRVLGIGKLSDASMRVEHAHSSSESNITLAVSHEDAVKLVAARESGVISAVLSSLKRPIDQQSQRSLSGDLHSLLGLSSVSLARAIPIMYGDRLNAGMDAFEEAGQEGELDASRKETSRR